MRNCDNLTNNQWYILTEYSKIVKIVITMSRKKAFLLANAILPLALGLFIYLFVVDDTIISSIIKNYIVIPSISIELLPKWIASFLRCYGADILWAYSLFFAVTLILGDETKNMWKVVLICSVFEVVIEIFQRIHFFPGTFDFFDIVFEILASFFALCILKNHKLKGRKSK